MVRKLFTGGDLIMKGKEKKKIRNYSISFPVNTWLKLKEEAERINVTQSALIKIAVNRYLDNLEANRVLRNKIVHFGEDFVDKVSEEMIKIAKKKKE